MNGDLQKNRDEKLVRIRELNPQELSIKKVIEYEKNTAEMLLDDMVEFQSRVDEVGTSYNMRIDVIYFPPYEDLADGHLVQLTMLRPFGHEVIDLDTIFPTFELAIEVVSAQFLSAANVGRNLQLQMTKIDGAPEDACNPSYKGGATFIISIPIKLKSS